MNAPISDAIRRALAEVTLDDKWTLDKGRAYMSGTQALIRLAMLQRQRDQLVGLIPPVSLADIAAHPWAAWIRPLGRRRSISSDTM